MERVSAHALLVAWLEDIVIGFDVTIHAPTLRVYKGQGKRHVDIIIEMITQLMDIRDNTSQRRQILLFRGECGDHSDFVQKIPLDIKDPNVLDRARKIVRKHLRKYVEEVL
jgi:hypothetical protein